MTSTIPQPATRPAPGTVTAVRVLIGVQTVVALVGLSMLGVIAAWGLGLQLEGDNDKLGLAVGLVALFGVLLAFTCVLVGAAGRLRRGRESARLALIAMQTALLLTVVLLTRVVGGVLNFAGFPAPALVLGVTAVGALTALVARPTRRWCHAC